MRLLPLLIACCALTAGATDLQLINNQPFAIHQPFYLRDLGQSETFSRSGAQRDGDRVAIIADVPAHQTLIRNLQQDSAVLAGLLASPNGDGLALHFQNASRGRISWGVVVHPINPGTAKIDPPPSTKTDFAATFKPLPLKFEIKEKGALFTQYTAESSDSGLRIKVDARCFGDGFIDLDVRVTNESAPVKDIYAAVVCRWEQPVGVKRSRDYDNHIAPFDDGASTSFREGTDRHLYIQRGVDWINSRFDNGSVLWMNDFVPSFTVHKPATAKQPARWIGANTAQLAQEAQATGNNVYSITEIARPNLKFYRTRLDDNVLPPVGESITITSRMIFDRKFVEDAQADQRFIAYTGFNPQETSAAGAKITFGVSSVRFGTSYFPYSTLGENFINLRQPGMSAEAYWPLAPETVKHFDKFADDIKRDLRIAKSMGFDLIRMHHMEILYNKDAKTGADAIDAAARDAYLDFFFGQLKQLQLKALLDVKLPPAELARLVSRYRDCLDGVEIDNEVLIFGIPGSDIQNWKDTYAAVKKIAPEIPVHLTAHTNTGAFDRLQQLGVPFDKIGEHAYLDAVEAIPSARDFALAAADQAGKLGKQPIITEWNWRFLTRMSLDTRAKIFPPIFENVLATRCMPTMYQVQFQDSLAMNPATLKGMRRYELLLLSRRPKPEAMEFEKLIDKYESPHSPHHVVAIDHEAVQLNDGKGTASFELTNRGDRPLELVATTEAPASVKAELLSPKIALPSGGTVKVPVTISIADSAPGFYHVFLRLDGPDGFLRYGWAECRLPGTPKIDKTESPGITYGPGALDFNFNRPLTVVYPNDAAPLDVEAAWTLFITLESATGRPVEIFQESDLIQDKPRAIIRVQSKKNAGPTVSLEGDDLLISGPTPGDVAAAAMNLTLRYWKFAKDSAIPRVGLTTDRVEQKGNKTDLE